uniref:EamA domain-containing protein n=1 Tax=Angiostrongylus cantonensis TaxID=6313 RepID=A0A0K0D6M4_ANGCA
MPTSAGVNSSTSIELLCVALLGLGQMFIMTGYDTQAVVALSQATCYAAYLTACLFAPSVLRKLSTKWTLFFGSLCFTIYQVGFLYLNKYYFYASCAVMGVGFASELLEGIHSLGIFFSVLHRPWFLFKFTLDEEVNRAELCRFVVDRVLMVAM